VKYCLWILLLVPVVITLIACNQKKANGPAAQLDEVPLLLEELDEHEHALPASKGPVADNGPCFVCHLNYDGEYFTAIHARNNIGCESCHGASYAHRSDEDNITPPDVMFPKDKVNVSCIKCHREDELKKLKYHQKFYANTAEEKYCNDCHGKSHHLKIRTRRWDKETGKLIADDKVRIDVINGAAPNG